MAQQKKRGYDALVEANRRANVELSAMLNRGSGPSFFEKSESGQPKSDPEPSSD